MYILYINYTHTPWLLTASPLRQLLLKITIPDPIDP